MRNPFTITGLPYKSVSIILGHNELDDCAAWLGEFPGADFASFSSADASIWQGDNNENALHIAWSNNGDANIKIRKFRKYKTMFSFSLLSGDAAVSQVAFFDTDAETEYAAAVIDAYGISRVYYLTPDSDDATGRVLFAVADNDSHDNSTKADSIRISLVLHNVNRRIR